MLPACIRDAMALCFSLSFALLNSNPHQETQKNPQPPLQTLFAAMDGFLRGIFGEEFEEKPGRVSNDREAVRVGVGREGSAGRALGGK
jgi:hypothetical protein